MIYLDNNATTLMRPETVREMVKWTNKGNPSASYKSATDCRELMRGFRAMVARVLGVREYTKDIINYDETYYRLIITSCASESNSTLISMISSAILDIGRTPHFIVFAAEHKGIIEQMHDLEARGHAQATYIKPTIYGNIDVDEALRAIQPDTVMAIVMHANNETGAINDVERLGHELHRRNVLLHVDMVQSFGKVPPNVLSAQIDSFSLSMHKLGGPPGVGVLGIRQRLYAGYGLRPMIYGTQNDSARGGTENIPAIGASLCALCVNFDRRRDKNATMLKHKKYIYDELSRRIPTCRYPDYYRRQTRQRPEIEIVFLSGLDAAYLPNTILLSVVKPRQPYICNVKLKTALADEGIIISIGSACNTASASASHVLYSMGVDEYIRKGALRISLCDYTTLEECRRFVRVFLEILKKEIS